MPKQGAPKMPTPMQKSAKRSKSEKSTPNLVDLHDDYLELIFKWLQPKDLLTIARCCKRFEQVIGSIIARKYAKEWIKITLCGYCDYMDPDVLVLCKMSSILTFLRCFGSSTYKLLVRFSGDKTQQNSAIEDYILQFCDAIKELTLVNCRNGAFDGIVKPFHQVEVVKFTDGHLGQKISNFNEWFPKLRSLTISYAAVVNKYCIEETMPSLESMSLKIGAGPKAFSRHNIDGLIRRNPQLRSYSVDNGCKPRDLRFVNNWLKQLEKLELWMHPGNFEKGCTQRIVFKELKELTLDIDDTRSPGMIDLFKRDSSNKHRLVCPMLEQLEIRSCHFKEKYFDFACGNTLKKLTIFSHPSIEFLTKYALHSPNLTEVSIQVDALSADDIVKFIESCQHLQKLNISEHCKLRN